MRPDRPSRIIRLFAEIAAGSRRLLPIQARRGLPAPPRPAAATCHCMPVSSHRDWFPQPDSLRRGPNRTEPNRPEPTRTDPNAPHLFIGRRQVPPRRGETRGNVTAPRRAAPRHATPRRATPRHAAWVGAVDTDVCFIRSITSRGAVSCEDTQARDSSVRVAHHRLHTGIKKKLLN